MRSLHVRFGHSTDVFLVEEVMGKEVDSDYNPRTELEINHFPWVFTPTDFPFLQYIFYDICLLG